MTNMPIWLLKWFCYDVFAFLTIGFCAGVVLHICHIKKSDLYLFWYIPIVASIFVFILLRFHVIGQMAEYF
jgi:hypothetical protein